MKIKISSDHFLIKKDDLKALLKIMKICIIFLFVLSFQTMAINSNAQDAVINLKTNSLTVGQLINEIEKQTEYLVVYSSREVNTNQNVKLQNSSNKVSDYLDEAFAGTEIRYEFGNNYIVLAKRVKDNAGSIAQMIQSSQQQGVTVTGKITDTDGIPVIGATIVDLSNPSHGTVTDYDGNYSIAGLSENSVLQISYVGMVSQEIPLNGRTTINIVMESDTEMLDEVVVVGFGTQRKENLTGAVTAVNMEQVLGDRPISSAQLALQGAVPGLSITGGSTPGQNNKTINIRGQLSINGGEPLILIDNVPGNLNMLNPEDIESVSVLKDAASSAIYGARAANGVVLVTTKRPKSGTDFKLNYNNNFGFSTSINRPEQAPLSDYFQAYLDAGFSNTFWANSQDVQKWAQYVDEYKTNPSKFNTIGDGIFIDTDGIPYYLHEKDIFSNVLTTGFYNTHNLSASGGTEKVRYRMSGGYSSEDGPLITDKDYYRRLNVSSYISADMTDWFTQELDIRYAQSKQSMPQGRGNDIYTLRLGNYYPEGLMPGSLTLSGEEVPLFTPKNLVLYGNTTNTIRHNPRIFSKSIIKPIKDLELVLEYTFDRDDFNYSYYSDKWKHTTIQLAVSESPANDVYTRQRYYTDYNAINSYATYNKSFGNHNLKAMGGFSQESSFYEMINNQVKDQVSSTIPSLGNATGEKILNENYSEYTIRGGFFRLNYNYLNKYLLEVNGRYDGSSKFPKSNRFGFFPSLSAGWQIAEEGFMEPTRNWLEQLKLRFSWGSIGNQAISPYQYTPSMGINSSNGVWLINGNKVVTIQSPGLVSSAFTWENVETADIGLDFSVLNNRLTGTFDWYQRDTKGMITKAGAIELPSVVGTEAPAQNGADMRTNGWELALNWRDRVGDLGYNIGFNLYDHQSKITKYSNETGLLSDYYEGAYLNNIWGYVSDGYYSIDDFEDTNSWRLKEGITSIQGYNVRPGDMKFKNLNDDDNSTNQIDAGNNTLDNPGDRKIIGNSTPRFQFGSNLGLDYKGFGLSVLLQGVAKREVWISGQSLFPFAGSGSSDAVFQPIYYNHTNYWKPISEDPNDPNYMVPENPNADYYRLYGQVQNVASNTRTSDKFLQDASYLRVKNITLSYLFPKALTHGIGVSDLKLFLGVENLATYTKLPKGIDPERLNWNYPFYRTVSFGANITF
ncbi:MAG TPA: TonB-dependent receptor [Spirochaetota bacterium]|nr:TonB-dependent receptor [Spirochaetota bacterium]